MNEESKAKMALLALVALIVVGVASMIALIAHLLEVRDWLTCWLLSAFLFADCMIARLGRWGEKKLREHEAGERRP